MKGHRTLTPAIGNNFLLDTNAMIALQREDVILKTLLDTAIDTFLPSIAVGELYFGAYKSNKVEENLRNVAKLLVNRLVLNVNADTANIYGRVKQRLRAKG